MWRRKIDLTPLYFTFGRSKDLVVFLACEALWQFAAELFSSFVLFAVLSSRKHPYIIMTPLNPTFIQ